LKAAVEMVESKGRRPVLLAEMTWPGVADAIARGEGLALMPVGAIEQHGRHLPLVTDTVIATAICEKASSLTGVPVLPTLHTSSSHALTTKWPGTLSFPPRLVIQIIVELSQWVRAAGFTKLLIVNAHGGNIGPLGVAVDEIRCAGTLQVGVVNYFELTEPIRKAVTIDGEDVHANSAETSLMLYLRPDLVATDEVRDDPDRTIGRVFSYTVAQTSIDGLTGRPSLANRDEGEELFEMIVSALVDKVEQARRETPPELVPV
jgi:creatinine amidohydrolase